MSEKKESKGVYATPSYVRRASKNYKDQHDIISLMATKGTKERQKNLGISNKELLQVIYDYLDDMEIEARKRNAEKEGKAE